VSFTTKGYAGLTFVASTLRLFIM